MRAHHQCAGLRRALRRQHRPRRRPRRRHAAGCREIPDLRRGYQGQRLLGLALRRPDRLLGDGFHGNGHGHLDRGELCSRPCARAGVPAWRRRGGHRRLRRGRAGFERGYRWQHRLSRRSDYRCARSRECCCERSLLFTSLLAESRRVLFLKVLTWLRCNECLLFHNSMRNPSFYGVGAVGRPKGTVLKFELPDKFGNVLQCLAKLEAPGVVSPGGTRSTRESLIVGGILQLTPSCAGI